MLGGLNLWQDAPLVASASLDEGVHGTQHSRDITEEVLTQRIVVFAILKKFITRVSNS